MRIFTTVAGLIIGLVIAIPAAAECVKSEVCDDDGQNCQVQDVCDDVLDLPSVELAPRPAMPSIDLNAGPSVGRARLGTSNCKYRQVDGRWQNVCE